MGCGGSTPAAVPKGAFKIDESAKAGLAPDKMWDTMSDFETSMQCMLGGENLTEAGYQPEGGSEVGKAKRVIIHEDRHYEEKLVSMEGMKLTYTISSLNGTPWRNCKDGLKVSIECVADGDGTKVNWTWEGEFLGPETTDVKKPGKSYEEFEKWVKEKVAKYTDKVEGFAEMM